MTARERTRLAAESRWALRLLIAVALLYTCHRALVLRIEYFDGFQFLANARAMVGDPLARARYDRYRAPIFALLELPGMLVVRASEPGAPARLIVPHCIAVLASLLAAAAVLWVLRRAFSPTPALFGVLLFVAGRYFVRYGAHVMADIASGGAAAATVAAWLTARDRRTFGAYGVAGIAFGVAVLTKFPLVALGPALVAIELWYAVRAREVDRRRWLGLVLVGAVGGALFVMTQAAVFLAVFGRSGPAVLYDTFGPRALATATRLANAEPGESPRDWAPMAIAMLGPTLVLAAGGLAIAVARREDRDVPFLAWLAVVGGGIVLAIGHNEARYLLPVVPALIYFAVRAVEAAGIAIARQGVHAARFLGIALLAVVVAPGVRQGRLDRDPVFFADVERRAALRMLEVRRPPGRLVWYGAWHSLVPRDAVVMREDENFNVFVFAPFVVEYFVDRPVVMPNLWGVPPDEVPFQPVIEDGDAVLQAARKAYSTANLPPAGVPPVVVWQVRRLAFVGDSDRLVSTADPRVGLRLGTLDDGERTLRADETLGTFSVLARSPTGTRHRLADVTLEAGRAVSLGAGSAGVEIAGLLLADVRRDVIR